MYTEEFSNGLVYRGNPNPNRILYRGNLKGLLNPGEYTPPIETKKGRNYLGKYTCCLVKIKIPSTLIPREYILKGKKYIQYL